MKRLLLYILLILGNFTFAIDYSVTYITTNDKNNFNNGCVKINKDQNNLDIIIELKDSTLYLKGISDNNFIKIVPNNNITSGHFYTRMGKLNGYIFTNEKIIIIIREN